MIEIVKFIYRYIKYPEQRKRVFLNKKIIPIQNKEIEIRYKKETKNHCFLNYLLINIK